jgi:hypothetical protein
MANIYDNYYTMEYYYNNVPGEGPCRNNLIYTSLISKDKKTFCQWYYNDTEYHKGQNEVVDPKLMDEKWHREMHFLHNMEHHNPDMVPKILNIDFVNRKLYLEVDGLDFWNRAKCDVANYNSVLPDWQYQMIEIIKAHKQLGLFKYSMHPSSYFVVDGKLKSINYFFTYRDSEPKISISDVQSHIHSNRQAEMRKYLEELGIEWNTPQPFETLEKLCWESFRTNYPADFIEKALAL